MAFLPLMYFGEMQPQFVEDYRGVIDGVVVAYLQDREEIERTWAILNDAALPATSEISLPVGHAVAGGGLWNGRTVRQSAACQPI